MDEAEQTLHELLLGRLIEDQDVDDRTASLVLAAWDGEDALASLIDGGVEPSTKTSAGARPIQHPEMFIAAVRVEGFRGIGEPATLPLSPGPGLTLVTGRNGSGKSSFAEAAELALTGSSGRWSGRTATWRDGWRNLHASGPTTIAVDLVAAGSSGALRIERRWDRTAELNAGTWTRQRQGHGREEFDASDWQDHMTTYRPFLSYSELGALIDGKPSELYDALHNLLGLGPLTLTQERIRTARRQLADAARAVASEQKALRAELASVSHERAARAADLLDWSAPDLAAVAALVLGADDDEAAARELAQLVNLAVPNADVVQAACRRLRDAIDRSEQVAAAESRSADELARLLRAALHHHDTSPDARCPVCGEGLLDTQWRDRTVERAVELEGVASELRASAAALDAATRAARELVAPMPPVLRGVSAIDTSDVQAAWLRWIEAGRSDGPAALAHALESTHPPLVQAVESVSARAAVERVHRDTVWGPLARRLAGWHDAAERVTVRQQALQGLTRAEAWLSAAAGELRAERLAPFADASQRVWRALRQQSNVDLGPVRLDGAKTRRRVTMDVWIDGVDGGTALGVMSQGELHALGLSLFLPRATVDESPFRFIMIDDPVQAMDPAKVDGLARVLAEVAAKRQVIVFSHDDRLADAVRRLELPATIWEVQRREHSAVALRPCDDPVTRYLDDARAIVLTQELPLDLRGELVASFCRSAIEAACVARIRRVRLQRGDQHAEVEATLAAATTTHMKATLAIFDDPNRGGDLLKRLRAVGPWAIDAFQACRKGAHKGLPGDLRPLVKDVGRLAEWIEQR